MAFNPVPNASESATLAQIVARESGGNYAATNPTSTASGAYQMINSTWQMAAANVGIDTSSYPTAASAPPALQDAAALWLLQTYGPNASITWAASAPPGGYSPPSFPFSAPGLRIAPESSLQTLAEGSD
jgi:hypothetical protein